MSLLDPRAAALAERALAGERRAIARLLTLFDDDAPGAREAAATLAARAGRARIVGVTGVPGSGKSTLVNALLGAWLARGLQVAVLAFDPSSPISGGAVLGDRIRMGEHGAHPNAFVRSFSARGELGGLSRAARAAIDCLDAAGFDRVIVETVGTGQSETRIAALADCRRRRLPARARRRRAGAEGRHARDRRRARGQQGRPAPRRADGARDARDARPASQPRADAWKPRVVVVRALAEGGIDGLLEAIEAHALSVATGRRLRDTRRRRSRPSPIRRRSPPTMPTAGGPACRRWPRATACAPRSASRCSPAARAARRWR